MQFHSHQDKYEKLAAQMEYMDTTSKLESTAHKIPTSEYEMSSLRRSLELEHEQVRAIQASKIVSLEKEVAALRSELKTSRAVSNVELQQSHDRMQEQLHGFSEERKKLLANNAELRRTNCELLLIQNVLQNSQKTLRLRFAPRTFSPSETSKNSQSKVLN